MNRYHRFLERVVGPPRDGPFAALDGIRGLAAMGVLVFHVSGATGFINRWFVLGQGLDRLGNFAVTTFFALSGFVLYLPYSRSMFQNQPLPRALPFLGRRVRRIFPGYWIALLGWALLASPSDLGKIQPIQALFLVDGYTGTWNVFSGLFVAWSLRIEIAFYLLIPLIAAIVAAGCRHASTIKGILVQQAIGVVVLVAVANAYRMLLTDPKASTRHLWLPSYLDCFAFGMLLAVGAAWVEAGGTLPVAIRRFADRAWPAAIGTALLYAAAAIVDGPKTGFAREPSYVVRIVQPPLQAMATFIMLVPATLGRREQRALRILSRPTLAALGAISFGLYLWHSTILRQLHPRIETGSLTLDMLLATLATTAPTLVIATLSYRFIERPELLDAEKWSAAWRHRMWPITIIFTAMASVAVFASSPGRYIADNRFEQFADPVQRLVRQLAIWDWSRGLGGPRGDAWLGLNTASALPHLLGLPPWATQRLTHVGLLVLMATGVVMVLREFRRQIGLEHLLAGALASFGPFSASFLLPSSLYSMAAICPWLMVAVLRGAAGRHGWRWAAIMAIFIALAANPDIPGLLYNGLAVSVTCVFVVVSRRASLRQLAGWLVRAAVLTAAACSWMLTKTYFGLSVLRDRLAESEPVAAAAATSSWSESIRGLGNWLSYVAWGDWVRKSATSMLLTNPLIVLATFAIPVAAFVMIGIGRARWTWFLGVLAIVSLTFSVGGYGDPDPTPFGGWWLGLMERVDALSSLRNTYKAAAGLAISTSILAALAVTASRDALARRSPRLRGLPVAVSLVVVGASIAPFSTMSAFEPTREAGPIPDYWTTAFEYLDSIPEPGRALFLPATSATRYRWGFVGDDILDAGIERPHAVATGVHTSQPMATDAIETITALAQTPNYRPGVLGPLARRLGITEIVLRNDVNWDAMRLPRPIAFNGIRSDPDFELVARFGDEGQNTTSPADTTPEAQVERRFVPVEVYRLRSATPVLRVSSDTSPIIVAGSSTSWPRLSADTAAARPYAPSGALSDSQLSMLLESGSPIAITDSARMRIRVLQDFGAQYSYTVNPDESLDRPPTLLYEGRTTSHSTTWYPDATSISSEGLASTLSRADRRPALAFDGDAETSWLQPWQFVKGNPRFRVELRTATPLGSVTVQAATLPKGAVLAQKIRIQVDGSSSTDIILDEFGRGSADLTGVTANTLAVSIIGFDRDQAFVGLSEIRFEGVDLREHVQMPTDLTAIALEAPASRIGMLVASAPTAYLFERSTRFQVSDQVTTPRLLLDEERSMLRRFSVVRGANFAVSGRYRITDRLDSPTLLSLLGDVPERADRTSRLDDACRPIGLTVEAEGGAEVTQVLVRLSGTVGDFLDGAEVAFFGCDTLRLGAGVHRLATAMDAAVASVVLRRDDWDAAPSATWSTADGASLSDIASSATATVPLDGRSTIVLATSFDRSWRATLDDRDLGEPLPIDAMTGWIVDGSGPASLAIRLRGERMLDASIAVTSISLLCCLALAGFPRHRLRHRHFLGRLDSLEVPEAALPQRVRPLLVLITTVAAGAVSVLLIGPIGLLVVPAVAAVAVKVELPHRVIGLASAVLLAGAAVTSVVGLPDAAMAVTTAYPRQRSIANTLALAAVVVALHAIALRIAAERQRPRRPAAAPASDS